MKMKRIVSFLITFAMLFTMMPNIAFAQGNGSLSYDASRVADISQNKGNQSSNKQTVAAAIWKDAEDDDLFYLAVAAAEQQIKGVDQQIWTVKEGDKQLTISVDGKVEFSKTPSDLGQKNKTTYWLIAKLTRGDFNKLESTEGNYSFPLEGLPVGFQLGSITIPGDFVEEEILKPTFEDIKDLLVVKVECETGRMNHQDRSYSASEYADLFKSEYFEIGNMTDGNRWPVTLTKDGAEVFAGQYTEDINYTHSVNKIDDNQIYVRKSGQSWIVEDDDEDDEDDDEKVEFEIEVICQPIIEQKKITNFTKTVVTSGEEKPEEIGKDFTYPENNKVTVPQNGSVTLLYKLTVTGESGAKYSITDDSVTVASGSLSGEIPAGADSVDIYVWKTFSNVKNGENLTNTATISAGAETKLDTGVGSATKTVEAVVKTPEPTTYDITVTVENGTATVDGENVTSPIKANAGEDVTIQFTGEENYRLPSVTVDGKNATLTPDGTYTFKKVQDAHSIHVVYEQNSDEKWQPWIRIYMDEGTKTDFEALGGQQVRIYSSKYPFEDKDNNYRLCAKMPESIFVDEEYWWTENNSYKLTSDDIQEIIFAKDKLSGSSDKIEIPHNGNETYDVKYSVKKDGIIHYLRIDISKKTIVEPEKATLTVQAVYENGDEISVEGWPKTAEVEIDTTYQISVEGNPDQGNVEVPEEITIQGIKYIYDRYGENDSKLTGTMTKNGVSVDVVYAADMVGGSDGKTSDGIPDRYQVTVLYKSFNSEQGSVTPVQEVCTIKDESEVPCESGTIYISGATATAKSGYAFDHWTMWNNMTNEEENLDQTNIQAEGATITEGQFISAVGGSTIAFTAYFKSDELYTIHVIFQDGNNNTYAAGDCISAYPEQAVRVPTIEVLEGKVLLGWKQIGTSDENIYKGAYNFKELRAIVNGNWTAENESWVNFVPVYGDESEAVYTVQVNRSYAASSGAGEYKAGDIVTIEAGSRDGYSFDGWESDDVDFEDADSGTTTFIMPAGDVTVTATWDRDSGGGGAHHPDARDDDDDDNDRDDEDDTEESIDEEVPLAETPWLNTEDHYAYIVGYSEDGTVRPNANITRAEVATIFFRLLTDEARDQFWMTTNNFSDVLPNDWYNNAVSTMVNMGIIQGYEDGTFRPNANITRAEFAAIAARFMSSGYDVEEDLFTDIANHWARESINDAAMAGWINGYEDGTFRPDAAITRAEAVTLVNNVLQRKPDADHMFDSMIKWPDNPEGAWYYEAIQEATNSHDYDLFEDAEYETWTALQENRDWAALEKDWVNTHRTGGEVA